MTADPTPALVVACPRCAADHSITGVEAVNHAVELARISAGFSDLGCPSCEPEVWGRPPKVEPAKPRVPIRWRAPLCKGSFVAARLLAETQPDIRC